MFWCLYRRRVPLSSRMSSGQWKRFCLSKMLGIPIPVRDLQFQSSTFVSKNIQKCCQYHELQWKPFLLLTLPFCSVKIYQDIMQIHTILQSLIYQGKFALCVSPNTKGHNEQWQWAIGTSTSQIHEYSHALIT